MMATLINRKQLKYDMKCLLADAQVSPKAMTALHMGILFALSLVETFAGDAGILSTFISVLSSLVSMVLTAGFALYCMAIRRGERAEFLTLFDGFSFVAKIIGLNIVIHLFISLWSMLFVIPGIVASYRYRFALYNLYENPGIGIMEALNLSKRQTLGYKAQLFSLDFSYIGWGLLSALPVLFYSSSFFAESLSGFGTIIVSSSTLFPVWLWTCIMCVWQLVVSLFYVPTYQCVELGYFEIAKDSSGIRADTPNHSGPDNMGHF